MRMLKNLGRHASIALFTLAAHGAAQAETFLDWFGATSSDGTPFIATVNDSGGYFGQWCDGDTQKCFWMISTKVPCKTGVDAPALVNTSGGAVAISATCFGTAQVNGETFFRNVLSPFDTLEIVAKRGDRISFAVAIEGDTFRVFRFSTKGVPAALFWMDGAKANHVKKKQKSTSDVNL